MVQTIQLPKLTNCTTSAKFESGLIIDPNRKALIFVIFSGLCGLKWLCDIKPEDVGSNLVTDAKIRSVEPQESWEKIFLTLCVLFFYDKLVIMHNFFVHTNLYTILVFICIYLIYLKRSETLYSISLQLPLLPNIITRTLTSIPFCEPNIAKCVNRIRTR